VAEPSRGGSGAAEYSVSKVQDSMKKIGGQMAASRLAEFNWIGSPEAGFSSSGFDDQLPPITGPTGTIELVHRETAGMGESQAIPPPGAKYVRRSHPETGLVALHYEVDPWVDIYEPWQEKVQDAFRGFDDLPDPADFDKPIARMQAAVGALTPLSDADGPKGDLDGDTFTSADLAADLGVLKKWIGSDTPGAWSGATILAFDLNYGAVRIESVLSNQAQLAIMLGAVLQGEQKIWEKARADTMQLMEDVELAFEPSGDGPGVSVNLGVVAALVDILSQFLPPAYQAAVEASANALNIIEPLMPKKEADKVEATITGGNTEERYESTRDAIAKLDGQILEREEDLRKSLNDLIAEMARREPSDFHIHPDKGIEPEVQSGEVNANPENMATIGYNIVPRIASAMARGAEDSQEADNRWMWHRTRVGLTPDGPYDEWTILLGELDKVATGSAAELIEAGRLLAAAAGGIRRSDEDTESSLKGLGNELDRGEYDYREPDPDHRPPPPGGPSAA
jgi:hypothetical protein